MSHFDSITVAPDGFVRHRHHPRRAGGGHGARGAPDPRRAVPPRGGAHAPRPGRARALPLRRVRLPAGVDDGLGHRHSRWLPCAPRWGRARVICALSGGVDSAVAAALVHKAIGPSSRACSSTPASCASARATRWWRPSSATRASSSSTCGPPTATSSARRDHRPRGQAQGHRRAVHPHLRRRLRAASSDAASWCRARSTPTSSRAGTGSAAKIKSHHNVGGLPDDMQFDLVEPLRLLFKDEVRKVGTELGLPDEIVWRQPFPGPGLGVRIIGEVTPDKVADPAAGRRHRARGDPGRRPRARDLAGLRRAARHPQRGRDGRRAHLRLPHHHPGRHVRGRHDRRLGPPALRPARAHVEPHHQRGRRRQPRGLRRHGTIEARRAPSSGSDSPSSTPGWPWRPAVGPPRWRGPTWPTPAVRCRT
jgi:hypothetical protein